MSKDSVPQQPESELLTCGIIIPISATEECPAEHWLDVRHILEEAIQDAGFTPQMVSEADDVGIIQKRIIYNVYSNPIVVCDVSAKNPNVMFELGMRLAFDKPTIIVKDDNTDYSFDTSPIEHLEYPRDLRFPKIVEFQGQLTEKLQGTYKTASSDPQYTTFLKNFGTFNVPVLNERKVSKETYILEEIQEIKRMLSTSKIVTRPMRSLCLRNCTQEQVDEIISKLSETSYLPNPSAIQRGKSHYHISISDLNESDKLLVLDCAKAINQMARLLPN